MVTEKMGNTEHKERKTLEERHQMSDLERCATPAHTFWLRPFAASGRIAQLAGRPRRGLTVLLRTWSWTIRIQPQRILSAFEGGDEEGW